MTMPIEIRQEIKKRLLEIEAYRSHSLHKEARTRCLELAAFIRNTAAITNRQALLAQLSKEVKRLDAGAQAFSEFSKTVKMSPKLQDVVRQLFTAGKSGGASADFETATALLVFGQRSAAMKAFRVLLNDDTYRIAAAKCIIRCHLGDGRIKRAVNQYLVWFKDNRFPPQLIDSIRIFLQAVLTKKSYHYQLPEPITREEVRLKQEPEEESIDFLSIVLPYALKRFLKKEVILDVNFQRGKKINCIVPKSEKGFIDFLRAGTIFPDAQINGTDMITFCSVRLLEVSKIRVGQHAGSVTITMEVMEDD